VSVFCSSSEMYPAFFKPTKPLHLADTLRNEPIAGDKLI